MKFIIILILTFSVNCFAQDWQTNLNEAKKIASKNNESIVIVFQGSDWCGPCMKLDKEVWSTPEFQKLSKDHFVMLKADFPRKKANKLSDEQTAQNAKLAELYNDQGYFPLVVVINSNGKVLGKMGYEKLSPKTYFNKLTSFEQVL
jgi:thioredoxin-related protein